MLAPPRNAIVQLTFEVKLPAGPNSDHVIIAGGADADRDGTIEDNGEYGVFTRNANTWTYTQTVPGPISGMAFYVQMTVGPNVPYELTIKDSAGTVVYANSNTTVDVTEYIRWSFA
jgi:hypothetical protein